MNEREQLDATDAQAALQRCFAQIRLARATELAQSRRFREAEAVLIHDGKLPENPRDLDLLARIAAQQGQFEKAKHRWKTAQHAGSNVAAYASAIRSLEQAQTAAAVRRKIAVISLAAIAIATLVSFSVTFWPRDKVTPPKPPIRRLQPSAPPQQTSQPPPVSVRGQIPGSVPNPEKR